jgi:hypothetical protein
MPINSASSTGAKNQLDCQKPAARSFPRTRKGTTNTVTRKTTITTLKTIIIGLNFNDLSIPGFFKCYQSLQKSSSVLIKTNPLFTGTLAFFLDFSDTDSGGAEAACGIIS